MSDHAYTELTVEIHVRPALLLEPVDAKVETLRTLEAEGVVEEVSLHAWPGEVSVSDQGLYDDAVSAFDEFDDWAAANDVSIRPPFSVRTRTSEFTGETTTVLSTPVMCVAAYLDGDLAAVFPHTDDGTHYSAAEAISAIRTGELADYEPAPADPPVAPGRCGDCGGPIVNVQGVSVCHDCLQPAVDSATGTRPAGDADGSGADGPPADRGRPVRTGDRTGR